MYSHDYSKKQLPRFKPYFRRCNNNLYIFLHESVGDLYAENAELSYRQGKVYGRMDGQMDRQMQRQYPIGLKGQEMKILVN